jgi:molybdenum cofactor cytidylyltransferase
VSRAPAGRLSLADRELIAVTGAGGKSTLILALARQLADEGKRVLVTTTTKMGPAQVAGFPAVCRTADRETIDNAVAAHGLVALITDRDDRKVTGPSARIIDKLFEATAVDYLLVEADGARGRSLKAPAAHEPVVPRSATLVIVVMGIDAVGARISDAAHRPPQAAALTGRRIDERLTVDDCVTVLTHPRGGLQGIPPTARVVVALTKVTNPEQAATAARLRESLMAHERISEVLIR